MQIEKALKNTQPYRIDVLRLNESYSPQQWLLSQYFQYPKAITN